MKHQRLPVRFTGQHFTIDAALIKYTIELAGIRPSDLVFDLGGEKGCITDHLLKKTHNIIVIENDNMLVEYLQQKFQAKKNVKVIREDIANYAFPNKAFKVVSNIPFSLTAHILKKLLYTNLRNFQGGCIITQLEPAFKMTQKHSYNPYAILYKTFYDILFVKEIKPSSFQPRPTVKSALLHIKKKENPVVPVELASAYLWFLFCLLKKPDVNALTALKKLLRKKQIRFLAEKYSIQLHQPIALLSTGQWANCFMEMRKMVPREYHSYYR